MATGQAAGGVAAAVPTQALLAPAPAQTLEDIEAGSDSDKEDCEEDIPLSTSVVTNVVGVLRQRREAAMCMVRFLCQVRTLLAHVHACPSGKRIERACTRVGRRWQCRLATETVSASWYDEHT